MLMKELAYEWLEDRSRSVEPSTYDQYKWDVDTFLVPLVGDKELESFEFNDLQAFVYAISEMQTKTSTKKHLRTYSQRTIIRASRTIKSVLRYAAAVGYVHPIVYKVRMPRAYDYHQYQRLKHLQEQDAKKVMNQIVCVVEHPEISFIDPDEKTPLAEVNSNRRYALGCILGLGGGLRMGEVCGIKRDDFSFSSNNVSVDSAVRSYKGKDGTKYTTEDGPTKTPKSRRVVPLKPEHIALFKQYAPNGYLIPGGLARNRVPYKRGFNGWFKRFITAQGFPDLSFHSLRHSYATMLIDAGVDIKTISELLGHAEVTTTAGIYIHPDESSKAAAINKLEW